MNLIDEEVASLVDEIYARWGYDFRDYASASLRRRILRFVEREKLPSVLALKDILLSDQETLGRFRDQIVVSVTSMFRDPDVYLAFRLTVLPLLEEIPLIRIWHAGCASGEEVYSMAILLHEAGLLERARIYATDIDEVALDSAKEGIYPLANFQNYEDNYRMAGGALPFHDYYREGHGFGVMKKDLSQNIVWASHNLVTDSSFNEFHVVFCRNVLIYFNSRLQERVHRLVYESLIEGGIVVLGRQESLRLAPLQDRFQVLAPREKIYQRLI